MPEVAERFRITTTRRTYDRASGKFVERTVELEVGPQHRRPKHIRAYLQRAIDLGMMRVEPSPQGFRYYAFESFFSLVEDPRGQLLYAYDAENPASREEQAKGGKEELGARYRAEQKAEEQRRQEAFRREWEAGAERRAQEAETRAREAEARRLASTARIVDGRLQCPFCSKPLLAQGEPLRGVRVDSFGDRHALFHGVNLVANRQGDNCWGVCKPEGCGRSFHLPKHLGACEECGRWQDVPEGRRHGICECGAFVREWQKLMPPSP